GFGPGAGAGGQQMPDFQAEIEKRVPSFRTMTYAQLGVGFLLDFLLLAAGIGLLNMKSWARYLSIAYAILSLLNHIVGAVWQFGFLIPALDTALEALVQGNPQARPALSAAKIGMYVGVVIGHIFVIYPIFVLIAMLLPSVGRAFAEGGWDRD